VREYGDVISLDLLESVGDDSSPADSDHVEAAAFVASRLAELDELITEGEAEVEAVRARGQSAPLQIGCSFFGIFFAVVVVITLFMVVARRYVGSLVFYGVLAATVILGLARVRKKAKSLREAADLKSELDHLEIGLSDLRSERDRVRQLQDKLRETTGEGPEAGSDQTT